MWQVSTCIRYIYVHDEQVLEFGGDDTALLVVLIPPDTEVH